MSNPRLFGGASAGNLSSSLTWLFDPNQVSTEGSQTGMWRGLQPADLTNVTLSGTITGLITTIPANATVTNNYVQSGSATNTTLLTGQILAANPARVQTYIQVIGSGGPLYVKLGAAPASQQSFSLILKAGSTDFSTDGGVWTDNGFWKGIVSISGQTRAIFWEA